MTVVLLALDSVLPFTCKDLIGQWEEIRTGTSVGWLVSSHITR